MYMYRGRIQQFLDRMHKLRYLTEPDMDIERQMSAAVENLLRAVVRNKLNNRYVGLGLLRYFLFNVEKWPIAYQAKVPPGAVINVPSKL